MSGEDGIFEVGNAHHDRRPQQDAADDFGDDARLADIGERIMQNTAEDDDDGGLDNEETDGVGGAVLDGVGALENASLGRGGGARLQGGGSIESSDGVYGGGEQKRRRMAGKAAAGHSHSVVAAAIGRARRGGLQRVPRLHCVMVGLRQAGSSNVWPATCKAARSQSVLKLWMLQQSSAAPEFCAVASIEGEGRFKYCTCAASQEPAKNMADNGDSAKP